MHRPVNLNQWMRTIRGAAKLLPADVARQIAIVTSAIDNLLSAGPAAGAAWLDLADTANIAETLASAGLGSGDEATLVLRQAQEALAYMAQEKAERNTWALRAEERAEIRLRLQLLRDVHRVQLQACSYAEFERAYRATVERLQQARAGNAPRDAVVVEGLIR